MPAMPAIPPVSPYLVVSDGQGAIEFYKKAFGAKELFKMMAEDGKRIMHVSLGINRGVVMLCDEFPEWGTGGNRTPTGLGGTTVTVHLQVKDADAAWNKAMAAGAEVVMPLADQFWGDRYGKLRDPYGHVWSVGATIKKARPAAKKAKKATRKAPAKRAGRKAARRRR